MMVASGARTCSGRHLRRLATLAVVLIMLGAVTSRAEASSLHRLASGTVAFSSDGTRYAAWQVRGDEQIVVFDTLTGQRRQITPPPGCKLHDEEEDGEPIISAAAGRFLLTCEEGDAQALLDVQSGVSVFLPKKTNGTSDWYRVGTRYVMGVNVLYDIATATSTSLHRPADLDAPGASTNGICPAVRHLVLRYQPQGLFKTFAYQGGLFAQGTGKHDDVQLDRCHGRPTILPGPSEPVKSPLRTGGEPSNFELGGGLLTWDTGHSAVNFEPNEETASRGTLSSYRPSTGRLRTWKLPRLSNNRGQDDESPGVYGYSAHTANTVFWIATRTLIGLGEEGIAVGTSSVYAASLRG